MSDQPPPIPPAPVPPPAPPVALGYAAGAGKTCPRCGQPAAKPVSFTWWGGALGPKLFSHHKCQACKFTFNGRTGKPNDTAIAIYLIISVVIGLAAGILIFFLQR